MCQPVTVPTVTEKATLRDLREVYRRLSSSTVWLGEPPRQTLGEHLT